MKFPTIVDQCMNRHLRPFWLMWPWPWPDDLIRTWPVFPGDTPDAQIWTSYVKAFESYRLTDAQTDRHDWNYTLVKNALQLTSGPCFLILFTGPG